MLGSQGRLVGYLIDEGGAVQIVLQGTLAVR